MMPGARPRTHVWGLRPCYVSTVIKCIMPESAASPPARRVAGGVATAPAPSQQHTHTHTHHARPHLSASTERSPIPSGLGRLPRGPLGWRRRDALRGPWVVCVRACRSGPFGEGDFPPRPCDADGRAASPPPDSPKAPARIRTDLNTHKTSINTKG